MRPLRLSAFTATSALGRGLDAHGQALLGEAGGLVSRAFEDCALRCWMGEVAGLDAALDGPLAAWDCRNHRLARLGLHQDGFVDAVARSRERHGPTRLGVFIGTSTSGVRQTERAYAARDVDGALPEWFDYRRTQNPFAVADFVRLELGLQGPALALSTACSSSAKVFASAHRAMQAGLCDAAVVGGVDSLCLTTLHGFNALQLVSAEACKPADVRRNGISIGEAAGFALLESAPAESASLALLGYGESSDAYHMSTPDPEGRGGAAAMRAALTRAGVGPSGVDYINLHGTATPANDLAEDRAVVQVFGSDTPCSSTKGWTGHTLGAAGILEAVLSLLCLRLGLLPRSLNTIERDPHLRAGILMRSRRQTLRRVLSNSFGFGGSNCSLLFGNLE
ncbi:MAG: beta-ketoacyl-[acyl-carrier-protein] synthase family protein [Panacagrimonas sp.]